MSAKAGWYPDPGGGQGLYRYWDGKAWSAATSPNPNSAPPPGGLGAPATGSGPEGTAVYSQTGYGSGPAAQPGQPALPGQATQPGQLGYGAGSAYANYQQATAKRSPVGWWIAAAALVVVIIVVAVFAIRAIGGSGGAAGGPIGGQPSQDVCPTSTESPETLAPDPNDGRVRGGPLSYPRLGPPWSAPGPDDRVPFGRDVQKQDVMVEPNYAPNSSWVASVLVAELMAGDGFYTPQQGAQIVVRCVLGAFYGDNEVTSDVKVDEAATIDGHDAWIVESQLSFDIANLRTKGELLIVAIVATGSTAGLYYASIPDTTPELVQPAREALANLKVDA